MKSITHLLFVCLFLATASVHAEPKRIELKNPNETYVHPSTQFRFPSQVGEFRRGDVHQYDQAELDVGAGYFHPLRISATVYVYPVPAPGRDLKTHLENCKSAIAQHPGATLVTDGPLQISPGGKPHHGLRAAYTIASTDFSNFQKGEILNSELYLFPLDGNRMLKFRITYPKTQQTAAEPAIKALINGFIWP